MSLASKMAAVESCDDGCDCERKISDLSWTKDSEKGAILRIKRKRTEDPFKALLVHHSPLKRSKEDRDDIDSSRPDGSSQNVFRFAGTIHSSEKEDTNEILKKVDSKISEGKKKRGSVTGHKTDINKIQDKLREQRKETQQISRYRITANNRLQPENYQKQSSQNQVHEDDSLEDQEVKRIFQVYDLVNDEKESNHHVPEEEADHQSKEVEEDTDTILCNSVKMIREKLTISNEIKPKDPEYVYDLYYATEANIALTEGLLRIEPFNEDILFDFEISNPVQEYEECYDDEDDSNDESNWRNDYPDEDQWSKSSEDEDQIPSRDGYEKQFSSDEEEYTYYGYRSRTGRLKFDPYYEDTEEYNYEIDDGADDSM